MKIPKQQILEFLRGDVDAVELAYDQLPNVVDTHRDSDLLAKHGVDPLELQGQFDGAGQEDRSRGGQEMTEEASQGALASQAKETIQNKTEQLKSQTKSRLQEEIGNRSTQAGLQVRMVAQAIRQTGQELHKQGQEAQAGIIDQLAQRSDRVGTYLTDSDSDRIMQDVQALGRRAKEFGSERPWLVAAGALALGFVAPRVAKALSSG